MIWEKRKINNRAYSSLSYTEIFWILVKKCHPFDLLFSELRPCLLLRWVPGAEGNGTKLRVNCIWRAEQCWEVQQTCRNWGNKWALVRLTGGASHKCSINFLLLGVSHRVPMNHFDEDLWNPEPNFGFSIVNSRNIFFLLQTGEHPFSSHANLLCGMLKIPKLALC